MMDYTNSGQKSLINKKFPNNFHNRINFVLKNLYSSKQIGVTKFEIINKNFESNGLNKSVFNNDYINYAKGNYRGKKYFKEMNRTKAISSSTSPKNLNIPNKNLTGKENFSTSKTCTNFFDISQYEDTFLSNNISKKRIFQNIGTFLGKKPKYNKSELQFKSNHKIYKSLGMEENSVEARLINDLLTTYCKRMKQYSAKEMPQISIDGNMINKRSIKNNMSLNELRRKCRNLKRTSTSISQTDFCKLNESLLKQTKYNRFNNIEEEMKKNTLLLSKEYRSKTKQKNIKNQSGNSLKPFNIKKYLIIFSKCNKQIKLLNKTRKTLNTQFKTYQNSLKKLNSSINKSKCNLAEGMGFKNNIF